MDAPDTIEHAVASLRPYMQRRMAKLALAGARFVVEQYEWKVMVSDRVFGRYANLEVAINETWRGWLASMQLRSANTECAEEGLYMGGPPDD